MDPTCPPVAKCGPRPDPPHTLRAQNWAVLIEAHVTSSGHFVAKGLHFVYDVDGQVFQQTFPHLTLSADTTPIPSPSATP